MLGGAAATEKGRKLANELGLEDDIAEHNAYGAVEEKGPIVEQKELSV